MRFALLAFTFAAMLLLAGCVAMDYSNPELCKDTNRYKLRVERDRCLYGAAILAKDAQGNVVGDESICEDIYTGVKGAIFDVTSGKIRAECFKQVAIKKAERYEDGDRTNAPQDIANICERISAEFGEAAVDSPSTSFKDDCFYEVAVLTRTEGICDRISNVLVHAVITDPATGEQSGGERPLKEVCIDEVRKHSS